MRELQGDRGERSYECDIYLKLSKLVGMHVVCVHCYIIDIYRYTWDS